MAGTGHHNFAYTDKEMWAVYHAVSYTHLLLHAGVDGMEAGKKLRPRLKEGAVSGKLPVDLSSALEKALSSALVKRTIPAAQLKKFAEIKRLEAEKHHQSDLESEREQYLDC